MNSIALEAQSRSDFGKGASRRLRRELRVPGIVYGGNGDPVAISLEQRVITKHLENEAFYSAIIDLIIDGKKESVLLRDLQHHPYKPAVMHVDFQRVRADEEVHVHVPLHFIGEEECAGVKAGGALSKVDVEIEVACLPASLPEYIEVDVTELGLGESIHLSQVALPEGVRSIALSHGEDNDRTIVSVHVTRATAGEGEEAEGDDAAAAEGDAAE
ncbi:50S ribosomal protein L25/general stress protein Ctc [Granulosicoccaceae sp. 1_MG-2023]|nr:50S ribosomal protein L25/general stress protein Ctc [Granulosicoccaceae sp. 1_MG-2023]